MKFQKKYRLRILLTISCALLAYFFYTFSAPAQTITIKISEEKSISTTYDIKSKVFEWLELFLLVMCVWIWRHELRLTGFGPFSGEPLEQQTPGDYREGGIDAKPPSTAAVSQDFASAFSSLSKEKVTANKNRILELLRTRHALNPNIVAIDLGVNLQTAEALLFMLVKEGILRCDGFPRSSLYTLAASLENLAIDRVRGMIGREYRIESEKRFSMMSRSCLSEC